MNVQVLTAAMQMPAVPILLAHTHVVVTPALPVMV
jgi:hypothetical protein